MDEFEVRLAVSSIEEHDDGSATVTFEMDEETKRGLIQYAINDLLIKAGREADHERVK